ncbi:MAG: thioredoxin domain-containing protein [Gordonia sp. (in: high G+C Gram-positive bacteria)]|uniref:DsbA family protein n=1 Tax=Gordonia sp. (in: high G+C Gram-positive bacteria) TaxID=84139 RepID=UPI0039E4520B
MAKASVDPREAERRRSLIGSIIAAVVVLAVAAGFIVWGTHKNSGPEGGSATPTVVTADGALRVSKAPAGSQPAVVVSVAEDFQCPVCRQFETTFGSTVDSLADDPRVAIDYFPLAYLDKYSRDEYSTRSANASMCVAEATAGDGLAVWRRYHDALFQRQPNEGGPGIADDNLADLSGVVGGPGIADCVKGRDYEQWLDGLTSRVTGRPGFDGTPDVRINGQKYDWAANPDPSAFRAAVEAALAAPH